MANQLDQNPSTLSKTIGEPIPLPHCDILFNEDTSANLTEASDTEATY